MSVQSGKEGITTHLYTRTMEQHYYYYKTVIIISKYSTTMKKVFGRAHCTHTHASHMLVHKGRIMYTHVYFTLPCISAE